MFKSIFDFSTTLNVICVKALTGLFALLRTKQKITTCIYISSHIQMMVTCFNGSLSTDKALIRKQVHIVLLKAMVLITPYNLRYKDDEDTYFRR